MIKRLYKAYDKLKEPKRFLVFFIPAALLLAGTAAGNSTVSLVCWIVLIFALITRARYIRR